MTNFEKITASPETLGTFLASLPIASGPWDEAFHRMFCDGCQVEDCDGQGCPHKVERGNPLWWLMQEAEGQSRIVMWVKRDGYRKAMGEFARKAKEARSERVKATGDKAFTHLEALLAELVEVLLPDKKCRVVMDYDPDAENVTFSRLPAHDIPAGT
ncbi:hypothetical protein [Oscillibacter sp. CU971]|uniref:hypothetical protein n=1 Tax=Oscillibacter sp. CU971 TaxID=2780102 RepID=UPI00195B01FD|nr:hypothetical protein [Oscillibacter sp. CU971]